MSNNVDRGILARLQRAAGEIEAQADAMLRQEYNPDTDKTIVTRDQLDQMYDTFTRLSVALVHARQGLPTIPTASPGVAREQFETQYVYEDVLRNVLRLVAADDRASGEVETQYAADEDEFVVTMTLRLPRHHT